MEGIGIVNYHIVKRLASWHPQDVFDCYFDRNPDHKLFQESNIHLHHFPPPTRLPILVRGWLNYPVRWHMQLKKSDVFYSPDGFVPMGMDIPKVSVVHDIAFVRYPEFLPARNRKFYDKWMHKFIQETDHIITVSEYSKKEIIEVYGVDANKVTVIYNGSPDEYHPLEDKQKIESRNKFSGGKPYFVNVGAIHPRKNILTLLKAFQLFKENSSSGAQLVLAGRPSWNTEDFFEALEQHPYKSEIHLPGYVPTSEINNLIGGAIAMIYPSWYEGFGLPVLEAMASHVPVISSNTSSLPEVAGDAGILVSPYDPEAFAVAMASIESDESLRINLIQAGREQLSRFSWDEAARQTYSVLEMTANAR